MRAYRLFLLTVSLQLAVGLKIGNAVDDQRSLEDLITEMHQVVTGDAGINTAQQQLARKLRGFGPASNPRLLALLDHNDEKIRTYAGYVIAGLDGLTDADLDSLMKARNRGDGWIPAAIGRIGTPQAIAFLVDDLRRTPQSSTQVTGALARAGEKAAPALAAFFGGDESISVELNNAIGSIFNDMGANAKVAVPLLLEFAANQKLPVSNRRGAVLALGAIGQAAADTVPHLKNLAKSEPEKFSLTVEEAIVAIGTPDAAEILVARLQNSSSVRRDLILKDIAALKENGRGAGTEVVKILEAENWDDRVYAAQTLGYIGYDPASIDLKRMIQSQDDWKLVCAAMESLGHLKDSSAVPYLRQLEKDHWSPVVRMTALKAVNVIQGREVYKPRWHPGNFYIEYFESWNRGYASSEGGAQNSSQHRFITPTEQLSPAELDKIRYKIEVVSFGENGRRVSQREITPDCALRFESGVLIGGDRGEWGGELAYLDEMGTAHVLVAKNTNAIHRMPFGVVATVGLAHMGSNSGFILLVSSEPGKVPSAKPWKRLPGAPKRSGVLENGDLFVACHGGDVLITPAGEFRRAE